VIGDRPRNAASPVRWRDRTPMGAPAPLVLLVPALLLAACPGPAPTGIDPAAVAENNRGVGLMGSFDYEGARAVFAGLARLHPEWLDVRVNEAIATLNRQQEGDEQAALAILDGVLAEDPDHLRAHYCSGLLRLFLGESEAAAAHFRRVVDADPDDAYAAYYLGQSLVEQGLREEALVQLLAAERADPYLRSAWFAAFRVLQTLGRSEEARAHRETYERLEGNPRARLAEFKYTRMGPRGEVLAVDAAEPPPLPKPKGPLFAEAAPLAVAGVPAEAWSRAPRAPASITAADFAGDGRLDLFIAGALEGAASNAVLVRVTDAAYKADLEHPLANVPAVNAAVWGDFDDDGLTDVYLLRKGENQLWRRTEDGGFEDVTASTGTGNGDLDSLDGAFLDADHDGDLDLFVVNADGPNELLNNDRDGGFRPLAAEQGVAGGERASRQVLATDLDGDRDVDLVVLNATPPHDVFRNDRLWHYELAPGFEALSAAEIDAIVAADADSDGAVELYTLARDGEVSRWRPDDTGGWRPTQLLAPAADASEAGEDAASAPSTARAGQLAVVDVSGDGVPEVLASRGGAWIALPKGGDAGSSAQSARSPAGPLAGWAPVLLDPDAGPSLVGWAWGAPPLVWGPGPGRSRFVALEFTGKHDQADAMRSNASGIGTRSSARIGSRWSVDLGYGAHSGPGRSLQPVAVGLGGAEGVDFVAIDWSDGVFQTELGLAPGEVHHIAETQRQLSSCPLLFAWDGHGFAFVSDVLGVGGIGQAIGRDRFATPRPRERFLLPPDLLRPDAGVYRLKLAQMMEEVAYVDSVELVAYDLPPGWQIVLDERMAGPGGPPPTGAVRAFRREWTPATATDARGRDVRDALARADRRPADPGPPDPRFLGLLDDEQVLELSFDAPLPAAGDPAAPLLLVIDGWVEYPYSQTAFAAWQAGERYRSLSVDARPAGGEWTTVLEELGYPAGMPRRMSVPLPALPDGARELRLRTNQEIYLDRVSLVRALALPEMRRHPLPLAAARVEQPGFARRDTVAWRRPVYRFGERAPFWDTRYPRGFYTALGPVLPLVRAHDDGLAVFGPGEALDLAFSDDAPSPPAGFTRRFVLEARGFAKDMDLYTRSGGRVDPLPTTGAPSGPAERLNARFNTRYRAGY